MIILSLLRRIQWPPHTPQMYQYWSLSEPVLVHLIDQYWLILLSCKGLFYKGFGGGDVVTGRDRVSGKAKAYLFIWSGGENGALFGGLENLYYLCNANQQARCGSSAG